MSEAEQITGAPVILAPPLSVPSEGPQRPACGKNPLIIPNPISASELLPKVSALQDANVSRNLPMDLQFLKAFPPSHFR